MDEGEEQKHRQAIQSFREFTGFFLIFLGNFGDLCLVLGARGNRLSICPRFLYRGWVTLRVKAEFNSESHGLL
ncbi:unnamed protein product [Meloidogyne enterolobii]|uniref:Uncharacterized protein n=1 Tax=Meloidogyne enterolobii TaxID=390850 RepID=A0ACB1B1F3_MELEN